MQQKKPFPSKFASKQPGGQMPAARSARPNRPIQSEAGRQSAAEFPNIGVTLRSYSTELSSAAARPPRGGATVVKNSRIRHFFRAITLKRSILILLVIILVIGGWLGYKFAYNAHKVFGGSIFGILSSTKLKGEDVGRVNILLAGNSSDDVGHNGADLTDSIMVMSIDTVHHKAFLLSVPRDLWVDIPNAGHQKINDAYVVGKNDSFSQSGYPSGGMGLLEDVIEQNMNININYFALINYNALRDMVNAVGGVNITVQSTDPRGLYDPSIDYATHGPLVKLSNGVHSLNGEQALDLARARGDAYGSYGFPLSDFDRTNHQRQMLVSLKSKIVSAGVVSNPAKLTSIADALGSNVQTDLKLPEAHRLYDLTKDINPSSITSIGLNNANGRNLLANYTSPDGESALIPAAGLDDFDNIQTFIKQQTSSDPVVQEAANIVVLNGSNTSGLASHERTSLNQKNFNVTDVGNAPTQATTTIIDASNNGKPATKAALQKQFGSTVTFTATNPYAGNYPSAQFIVILGTDQSTQPTATNNN